MTQPHGPGGSGASGDAGTASGLGAPSGALSETARRKDDHLRLAMAQHTPDRPRDYDHVTFVHHALAGGASDAVSLGSPAFGWPVPLYVSGMTGGTEQATRVNRGLGVLGRETGLPVAVGSMGIVLREPETAASFTVVREENPDGFVLANTNANVTGAQAAHLVDVLGADALQVHLNAPQEIAMPEGDRDFSRWADAVAEIVAAAGVPVVVKEVGAGLSRGTIAVLRDLGVAAVDVAGRGGTDFGAIESARRPEGERAYLAGWGQSAVTSLLEAAGLDGVGRVSSGLASGVAGVAGVAGSAGSAGSAGVAGSAGSAGSAAVALLASGGVRHALDVVRALALGADAVGVAGTFLHTLLEDGPDALVALVQRWLSEIRDLMALLGADDVPALRRTDVLLSGPVREYAELRGLDVTAYARRSDWSQV